MNDIGGIAKAADKIMKVSADEVAQQILDDCEKNQEFLERVYKDFIRSLTVSELTEDQKLEAVTRALLREWRGFK